MKLITILASISVLVLATVTAHPSPQGGGAFLLDEQVVYGPSGMTQSYPAVAFDGTNHLVVWTDHRCSFNDDIYAARVTPQGDLLDPGGILVSTAAVNQSRPDVSFDGANFLVVWQDQRYDQGDIFGARISPAGKVLDPGGIPIAVTANGQQYAKVVFDGANHLVVWEDARQGSYYDVYGARVSPAGSVLDPAGIAVAAGQSHQRHPAVASDGVNCLVVWEDDRGGSATDLYGARVDRAGSVLDPSGFAVSTATAHQKNAAVAFDGTNYLAVWDDGRSGSYTDIHGARVTPSGTLLDPTGIAVCTAYGSQSNPTVSFNGSVFVAAWSDYRGSSSDVYAARVDGAGVVLDPSGIAISAGTGIRGSPRLAAGNPDSLVVWHDTRDGGSWAIYGSRLSPTGAVVDPAGILLSAMPYNQYYPAAAFGATNHLAVWQDYRSGTDQDIYGARVSPTGRILDPTGIPICTAADWQGTPAVAFDGVLFLVVWADMRNFGEIDVYGARVDRAGTVLDPGGIPICTVNQLQMFPHVAFNGTDFLVVWHDWRHHEYDIYGSRVDRSGTVLDPGGIAISRGTGGQYYPAVASDGDGCLVVWHDSRASSYAIFGSRVDTAGVVLDPAGIAVSSGGGSGYLPAIGFGGGNYLVTWNDYRSYGSDIYGTRVTPAGSVLDPYGIAIATGSADQQSSTVAFDGSDFVVAWQDDGSGDSYDILGAALSPAGTVRDRFDLARRFEDQITPSIAHGQGGQVLAAWCGFAELIGGQPANTMRTFGTFRGSTLAADPTEIPAGAGGSVAFTLSAGTGNGGRRYVLLAGASGTAPGTLLPGGAAWLPVNRDVLTDFVLKRLNGPVFAGFTGFLDGTGGGNAQLIAPPLPPGLAGRTLHFAYCLAGPFDFVSQPVDIMVLP